MRTFVDTFTHRCGSISVEHYIRRRTRFKLKTFESRIQSVHPRFPRNHIKFTFEARGNFPPDHLGSLRIYFRGIFSLEFRSVLFKLPEAHNVPLSSASAKQFYTSEIRTDESILIRISLNVFHWHSLQLPPRAAAESPESNLFRITRAHFKTVIFFHSKQIFPKILSKKFSAFFSLTRKNATARNALSVSLENSSVLLRRPGFLDHPAISPKIPAFPRIHFTAFPEALRSTKLVRRAERKQIAR